MGTTLYAHTQPTAVAELDGRLTGLHADLAAIDAELAERETTRAHLDAAAPEDDTDHAYVAAVAAVRQLRRRRDTVTAEIATATAALHAAQVAALRDEEAADAADREAVETALAQAAATLAAYEGRLRDRWNRRNELGLPMPSRLDAIPARLVHQLAAQHFGRFGLASGHEGKRF